ncbi:hypothetical protein Vafri_8713 [Volvox africanus]|uniref:Uncharacterized protein n=1 Tax=Volvox africanus TaxID=51714 RepID=A0A8J4F1R4_9CHLO|nr:hypothetical protein Vafri_8713 [Volvox africanus]
MLSDRGATSQLLQQLQQQQDAQSGILQQLQQQIGLVQQQVQQILQQMPSLQMPPQQDFPSPHQQQQDLEMMPQQLQNMQQMPPPQDAQQMSPPQDAQQMPPPQDAQQMPPPQDAQQMPPPQDAQQMPPPQDAQQMPPPQQDTRQQDTEPPQQQQLMNAQLPNPQQQKAQEQLLMTLNTKLNVLNAQVDVMGINTTARFHNSWAVRGNDKFKALVVESPGGLHAVGTAPPEQVPFPANVNALFWLEDSHLNEIQAFYNVSFPGSLKNRRRALAKYIGAFGVLCPRV